LLLRLVSLLQHLTHLLLLLLAQQQLRVTVLLQA
jgi:hypothetical protein